MSVKKFERCNTSPYTNQCVGSNKNLPLSFGSINLIDLCCVFPVIKGTQKFTHTSFVKDHYMSMQKRTWQPKKLKRLRGHGFLARMATVGGRKVINARRAKGRKQLTVTTGTK